MLKKAADGGQNVEVSRIASCVIMKFVSNNKITAIPIGGHVSLQIAFNCFKLLYIFVLHSHATVKC